MILILFIDHYQSIQLNLHFHFKFWKQCLSRIINIKDSREYNEFCLVTCEISFFHAP